jgi:hypothetical protein
MPSVSNRLMTDTFQRTAKSTAEEFTKMTGQKTGGKFRIFVTAFFVLGGSCLPGEAGEMGATGESNLYRGSSGALYNYDLSNPSDQLRYSVDPGAQLRDSINVDPRIELDRSLGQYGGGAGH